MNAGFWTEICKSSFLELSERTTSLPYFLPGCAWVWHTLMTFLMTLLLRPLFPSPSCSQWCSYSPGIFCVSIEEVPSSSPGWVLKCFKEFWGNFVAPSIIRGSSHMPHSSSCPLCVPSFSPSSFRFPATFHHS